MTAGLDIEMPYRMVRAQHLAAALERGDGVVGRRRPRRRADRGDAAALRRRPLGPGAAGRVLGSPAHRELAREVAARSVVLLRNEPVDGVPVLPLADPTALRVAVLGRLADTVNLGDGGSSDVWDLDCRTVLDGLRAASPTSSTTTGATSSGPPPSPPSAESPSWSLATPTSTRASTSARPTRPSALCSRLGDEPDVVERFAAALTDLPPTTKPAAPQRRAAGSPGWRPRRRCASRRRTSS